MKKSILIYTGISAIVVSVGFVYPAGAADRPSLTSLIQSVQTLSQAVQILQAKVNALETKSVARDVLIGESQRISFPTNVNSIRTLECPTGYLAIGATYDMGGACASVTVSRRYQSNHRQWELKIFDNFDEYDTYCARNKATSIDIAPVCVKVQTLNSP